MKFYGAVLLIATSLLTVGCTGSQAQSVRQEQSAVVDSGGQQKGKMMQETEANMKRGQNDIGELSPEAALDYMKRTPNIFIVDAATKRWYNQKTFVGAVNIPVEELTDTELDEAIKKLPNGQPIIVHCRLGMVAPHVYSRIKEIRPDIPEIAWLHGKPLFDEYNEWVQRKH